MPQLGLEVTEGTVVELFVQPGAAVAKDEPLMELETDKASTDVVAPRDGVLRFLSVGVGDVVPVGDVLALMADTADEPLDEGAAAGEAADAVPAGEGGPDAADAPNRTSASDLEVDSVVQQSDGAGASGGKRRRRVAPIARRAAADLGIAVASVSGTGPRGRVTLDDVRRAAAERDAASHGTSTAPDSRDPAQAVGRATLGSKPLSVEAPGGGEDIPVTPTRRAIARRMTASQLIPQYQLQRDVDASHLLAQKAAQAEGRNAGARVGVNDLLVQAIAETVRRHPDLAVRWVEEDGRTRMVRTGAGGVGLAAASDKGLVVPVIRDPQTAGLAAIAEQRSRLVAAARDGSLGIADMAGSVITLSNLGGFGVDRFAAMLNPGESAIVAVGRAVERVVPRRGGTAVVPILAVTVSFDHRVIDGAVGAAALGTLVELLEGGMTWRP